MFRVTTSFEENKLSDTVIEFKIKDNSDYMLPFFYRILLYQLVILSLISILVRWKFNNVLII